ncbi:MAG: hypothetical protein Q8882_08245 [Bacillota bacterium]|nr:hypothetical protein [Bacillota bacterium]
MKKILCKILSVMLTLSFITVCCAAEMKTFTASDIAYKSEDVKVESGEISFSKRSAYVGFKNVDLTGIKSFGLLGSSNIEGGNNGEAFRIKIDDPKNGDCIAYILLNKNGSYTFKGNILKEIKGTHDLFIMPTYSTSGGDKFTSLILYDEEYKTFDAVPDKDIVDNYHDTWMAVDDMGRCVADYEEAGPVKEGTRKVGMFYWDWHTGIKINNARIPSEIIAAFPEAKKDFNHTAWDTKGKYFWSEPVFGFYSSYDYWVYRKQAQLLSDAGVDVIFMDYTNGSSCYISPLVTLRDAFHDARANGLDVPKISIVSSLGQQYEPNTLANTTVLTAVYLNVFQDKKYSDLWFYWDGKPLLMGNAKPKVMGDNSGVDTEDKALMSLFDEMNNFFTFRGNGDRVGGPSSEASPEWIWLENFPQHLWNRTKDGRVENITVGTGINESTIYKGAKTAVFSDEYSKGRGFSQVFGEDYSTDGKRKGYFFREQSNFALEVDPAFIFIDGWNEWNTVRYSEYSDYRNAFVDTFDDENSRDFEPSKGVLKDDYYNLLVDFIRKYKGVRPAPTATAPVSININGDLAEWDSVGPEFINDNVSAQRDADGFMNGDTGKPYHYTTKVTNNILRAKVARDSENLYFYVKTEKNIVTDTAGFMHLYINTDRNRATGWEGYDYVVGREEKGVLERSFGGFKWEKVSNVTYSIKDNVMQVVIPRKAIFAEGTVNLEFKWVDGANENGDLMNFYVDGSVAPMGRFNYLYTEVKQTAVTKEQRAALKDTTIIKTDSNRMMVNGGKMYVYEPDTRYKAIEKNGTIYIPAESFEDVLGFGKSKVEYDAVDNVLYIHSFELSKDFKETENYKWAWTTLGSYESRVNGELKAISQNAIVIDGIIYAPITMLKECFGWSIYQASSGIWVISKQAADTQTVNAVLSQLK